MEGKLKNVVFMILLAFAFSGVPMAQADNYIAKSGNVFDHMDPVCKNFIARATIDIALIPEALWDGGADWCGYETIACAACATGSYSVLVVGVSEGADSDKIIISNEEFPYIAGQKSASGEITVTYTEENPAVSAIKS